MKILHTSDWHLGARLGEYSRLEEQKEVLIEIREIAEHEDADAVIIAGDVFDNFNPSNEAVELLYRELKKLADDGRRPVIVIAGNHDSPDRIETPDPLAAECGIFFIGYPDFRRSSVQPSEGVRAVFPEKGILILDLSGRPETRILTTPYANENRLRKYLEAEKRESRISELLAEKWKNLADQYCDKTGINLLTAHLFMAAEAAAETAGEDAAEPEGERSILHPGGLEMIGTAAVPPQIQYTALGHLHRPQTIRSKDDEPQPVVYSGSPLAFGLSEQDQQKSVVIAEIEPGKKAEIRRVPLQSGRRIVRRRFDNIDSAVEWLSDNPNVYVELIIACDNYISAEERRRLYDAHSCITAVIPAGREDSTGGLTEQRPLPDLTESMEDIFKSYFEYAKGAPPDEQLLAIFHEIASAEEDAEEDAEANDDT